MGNGGMAPHILNFCTRLSGKLHILVGLAPGKKQPVPSEYEVGWAPEPAGRGWEGEYETSRTQTPVVQPVVSHYTDSAIPEIVSKRQKGCRSPTKHMATHVWFAPSNSERFQSFCG
jgi:hypothetical protein